MSNKYRLVLEKCINCYKYLTECPGDYKVCGFLNDCFVSSRKPIYKQLANVNNIVRFTEQ
nr:MAG TPA: hypothetical protein [Bacteriophage sp.]